MYLFHLLNHYFLQLRKMCAKVIWSLGSAQRSRLRLKVIQHLPAPSHPTPTGPYGGPQAQTGAWVGGKNIKPEPAQCANTVQGVQDEHGSSKTYLNSVYTYFTLYCATMCSVQCSCTPTVGAQLGQGSTKRQPRANPWWRPLLGTKPSEIRACVPHLLAVPVGQCVLKHKHNTQMFTQT